MRRLTSRQLVAATVLAVLGGCASPEAMVKLEGELDQAANAINDLRLQLSTMQATIDSLTIVAAKHDTTIFRVANATGVQIAK